MAITQTNEYQIGVNNDLGNLANNVDNNRIGEDLTWLEIDAGEIKVSVGSFIESQGNLYVVDGVPAPISGDPGGAAYLFFDESVPQFVWSRTQGTLDTTRGGIYDASNRRQCRWISFFPGSFQRLYDNGTARQDFKVTQFTQGRAFVRSTIGLDVDPVALPLSKNDESVFFALFNSSTISYVERKVFAGDDTAQTDTAIANQLTTGAVALDDVTIAGGTTTLTAYRWNGAAWAQLGSSFSLPVTTEHFTRISPTEVLGFRNISSTLSAYAKYSFDGSTWSQVGTEKTQPFRTTAAVFVTSIHLIAINVGGAFGVRVTAYDYDDTTVTLTATGAIMQLEDLFSNFAFRPNFTYVEPTVFAFTVTVDDNASYAVAVAQFDGAKIKLTSYFDMKYTTQPSNDALSELQYLGHGVWSGDLLSFGNPSETTLFITGTVDGFGQFVSPT